MSEVKARAQLNEFMYYILKENGIALQLDENISTAFFDHDGMNSQNIKFKIVSNRRTSLNSEEEPAYVQSTDSEALTD